MAVNLSKGQRVSLDNSMRMALVGLGWDTNKYDGGFDFDLDASAFLLGANGKCIRDEDFVFYNNLNGRNGAVVHQGDNLTGEGDGDDETVKVDLSKISANAAEICFVVTIHKADERKQNFGQVRNSFIRIYNPVTNEEIMKYELEEDFSIETAVEFGRLYRRNGQWKFEAIGVGQKQGLQEFLNKYN